MTPQWLLILGLLCAGMAQAADVQQDTRLSGNAFLPPGLHALQDDVDNNPITLWLDRGRALWSDASAGRSCQGCHGDVQKLRSAATHFPRLDTTGKTLMNLEDQIVLCSQRTGRSMPQREDDEVLALSALLHQQARGQTWDLQAPAAQSEAWNVHLARGATLFVTRQGRINLACVHCHEERVGRHIGADVVSQGHPTGFPIYRMSWQRLGSLERRLRACYSGVQAVMPPPGAAELRDLELYLKVRATGMPLEGPSIRR